LGGRKGIRPVKREWWDAGVVICPERGADLHTAQLMPLPLTVSCFSKVQIGFTFLVPAHPGGPGQRAVKRVCVCVCVNAPFSIFFILFHQFESAKINTHLQTHPINGHFSGITWVSRYQKGKTNQDFTEARDSEWQWHQLGHMQVCTSLQTDNHASTPPLSFLQAGCPSCRPTNSVKAPKAKIKFKIRVK